MVDACGKITAAPQLPGSYPKEMSMHVNYIIAQKYYTDVFIIPKAKRQKTVDRYNSYKILKQASTTPRGIIPGLSEQYKAK